MDRRLPRRKLALSIGALVLAVPGVSACGFSYATDRAYNPGNGANNQDGTVDVLNAVIVSSEQDSGTFIATLSNNSTDEPISLESLSFGSNATVEIAPFDPVEVPAQGLVNLGDDMGIKVAGEITAGDFIEMSLGFSNGEESMLNVHIVAADNEYSELDNGTGVPAPAGTPSAEEPAE